MDAAEASEPLIPAPRHLRKRRFHRDVPDTLLVPGQAVAHGSATADHGRRDEEELPPAPRETARRRKRAVALALVILVLLSIPVMLLALLFVR